MCLFYQYLQPFPYQHYLAAAIGCSENGQPIGLTIHCFLHQYVDKGCVAVDCEKKILNTLYNPFICCKELFLLQEVLQESQQLHLLSRIKGQESAKDQK